MSDPVPPPEPAQPWHADAEVSVDLAAFLPDGVVVGEEAAAPPDAAPADATGVDLSALDQVEADLAAVDAAIAALDAGTYGIDAATGAPIPDAELAADPTRCS